MEKLKINDTSIDSNGTHAQGEFVGVSYTYLVEKLGEPMEADGYKVDAEWELEADGIVATVYNWKDGRNYNGAGGLPVEQITHWHIGGHDKRAIDVVKRALGLVTLEVECW